MNFFKQRRILIEVSLLLILALYIAFFNPSLFTYKNDHMVGYADSMEYVRPLDDVLHGNVPYRDFYWMYGPLFLYIQLPVYFLLGQNHSALFAIWCSYLPFLSIVASYLWAVVFFPTTFYRLIFVLLCLLQNVNLDYSSLRHLMAELGIAIFVLALRAPEKKKLFFLSGLMSAAALLTSQEYGIASVLAVTVTWFLLYASRFRLSFKHSLLPYFAGVAVLLLSYYSYLGLNGALKNYLFYIYGLTKGFSNPARSEMFPVFPYISVHGGIEFLRSAYSFLVSKNFRFYLPLAIYAFSFFYFCVKFYKGKEKNGLETFLLLFYGLLIFVRTLSGPGYGYFTYGLVPPITLGLLGVRFLGRSARSLFLNGDKRKAVALWIFLGSIYGWVFLTAENTSILNIFANLNLKKRVSEYQKGKVFNKKVGYFLSPKANSELKNITEYIETHTGPKEYVYVYPWGPYNHLAKRPSPLTARDPFDLNAGPYFMNEALRQMEMRKPGYVILNISPNNLGVVHMGGKRGDTGDSATWGTLDSPSFLGKGDKLQVYILENYELEKAFDYAAIFKRRNEKRAYQRNFTDLYVWKPSRASKSLGINGAKSLKGDYLFRVTARKSVFVYRLDKPVKCSHAEITFTMKNNILKGLISKNLVHINLKNAGIALTNDRYIYDLMNYNTPQVAWLGFSGGMTATVDAVEFEIDTPAPYVLPQEFEVREIKLLLETPQSTQTHNNTQTQQLREATLEDKVISSTLKNLAKAFVMVIDLRSLKVTYIKKLEKMDDSKFLKKYAKTYPYIMNLPDYIKMRYGVANEMTREQAVENLKTIDKDEMYELIECIPDAVVADNFRSYFKKDAGSDGSKSSVQDIGQSWKQMTSKVFDESK